MTFTKLSLDVKLLLRGHSIQCECECSLVIPILHFCRNNGVSNLFQSVLGNAMPTSTFSILLTRANPDLSPPHIYQHLSDRYHLHLLGSNIPRMERRPTLIMLCHVCGHPTFSPPQANWASQWAPLYCNPLCG